MPKAYNLLRPDNAGPVYRREAFGAGLEAAGYEVVIGLPVRIQPGDALCIWNRYEKTHELACRFERVEGCTVFVAENGYVGPGGVSPHHMEPRSVYALARGAHNDGSVIRSPGPERWRALGVDLKPWRTAGEHILVCPNRSFGTPGRIQPPDWPEDVCRRLKQVTDREIRVRPHPGNDRPAKPLADDLAGAWACVIWHSSAGVHALIAGVPVICEAPKWICRDTTFLSGLRYIEEMEPPREQDSVLRRTALERLAWAQWSLGEIASGEAFRHVMECEDAIS